MCLILCCQARATGPALEDVYERLYSFDFERAASLLDQMESTGSAHDPMVSATRAALLLFSEMNRLGILSSEFFNNPDEELRKVDIEPSEDLRRRLFASIGETRNRAGESPAEPDAQFALALADGIEANYSAFILKQRLKALPLAKQSHRSALRTLELDPENADAHLMLGINQYVLGAMPFFLRWFISFEGIEGGKDLAIERLRRVAASGRYLGPYAQIMLATIYIREERYREALAVTRSLAEQFPENDLFQRELRELQSTNADS